MRGLPGTAFYDAKRRDFVYLKQGRLPARGRPERGHRREYLAEASANRERGTRFQSLRADPATRPAFRPRGNTQANTKPCTTGQPSWVSKESVCSSSAPSATTCSSRLLPTSMISRAIVSASSSVAMPRTKLRSTFQLVERKETSAGRVTSRPAVAEVIQGDRHPEAPKLLESAYRRCAMVHERALGDLERQHARLDPVTVERVPDGLGKRLIEQDRGADVDGDRQPASPSGATSRSPATRDPERTPSPPAATGTISSTSGRETLRATPSEWDGPSARAPRRDDLPRSDHNLG